MRLLKLALLTIGISLLLSSCDQGYPIEASNADASSPASPQDYTATPPIDCDTTTTITGIEYRPIGSGIQLRLKPSLESPPIVNARATEIMRETQYLHLDDTTKVIEECTKEKWSWVRLVEPEHLVVTHKGWIESKYLPKETSKNGDKYFGKISSSALIPYKVNDGYEIFESRFNEIEKFRRKAAELFIDSGACNFVVSSDLSVINSTEDNLQFWVECENSTRQSYNESELVISK